MEGERIDNLYSFSMSFAKYYSWTPGDSLMNGKGVRGVQY